MVPESLFEKSAPPLLFGGM